MSRNPGKTATQRQLRVGEELRHVLVRILGRGELDDPVLADQDITVTEVRVSPDLKNATAFVTPFGGAEAGPVVAALNRAAGFLRRLLASEINLRYTPRLSFEADVSFDYATRVQNLLNAPRVRRDLAGDGDEGRFDAGEASDRDGPDRDDPDHGA